MGRSSSDSRPTIPPPFDVARFARDSDARAVTPPSDEYEIEVETAFRSASGIRATMPIPPPTSSGVRTRPPRPTPIAPYEEIRNADSVGALEIFIDADPVEELLASIEIEVAEPALDHSSDRPPGPRSKGPPLSKEALRQIPTLAQDSAVMGRMGSLDPKTAFLISRFDGYSDLETVIDVSGMKEEEAKDLLLWLLEQGIVVLS